MAEIKPRSLVKSEEYYKRALKYVPAQCHTLSHGPTQWVSNVSPKFLKGGKGCIVWDVDGNEYLDLAPGGYPIILGYGYKPVVDAVTRQLENGNLFPMPHYLEVETAELLSKTIPCAEMSKFAKNGSDVTAMAVRVSRAYTKRDKVATGGYHGFQDWFIGTTNRISGIPEAVRKLTLPFKYNNIESLQKLFEENPDEIAAVILEPIQLTQPKDNFLQKAKKLAQDNGAVFIFDEIITGFRVALGGAQEYFDVKPDLATFGKSMSNGMPLSALVGKREIMENFSFDGTFFSSTFGGETASLAAACATIKELKEKKVIPFIWAQGKKLQEGFNKLARENNVAEYMQCIGLPCASAIHFDNTRIKATEEEMHSLFQQECIKRGMLAGLYHAMCYAHTDEYIKRALEIYDDAMKVFRRYIDQGNIQKFIEGSVVKPVFRHRD